MSKKRKVITVTNLTEAAAQLVGWKIVWYATGSMGITIGATKKRKKKK